MKRKGWVKKREREPKLAQSSLLVSPSCSRIWVQRGERVSGG